MVSGGESAMMVIVFILFYVRTMEKERIFQRIFLVDLLVSNSSSPIIGNHNFMRAILELSFILRASSTWTFEFSLADLHFWLLAFGTFC